MNQKHILAIFIFILSISFIGNYISFADHKRIPETDFGVGSLYSFFDLRDRETFVQVTNTANTDASNDIDVSGDITVHVQIFNVADDCNENNFFDTLTPNDTHVYNMRDILTNNGAPSGVILPNDAYGFIVISAVDSDLQIDDDSGILIGNVRILDESGYEYRTNSAGQDSNRQPQNPGNDWTFNYNTNSNIILSDIVGIVVDDVEGNPNMPAIEVNILDAFVVMGVDIFDNNEVAFSCRNIIFSCVDEDNPLLEALLEEAEDEGGDGGPDSANVASFEYGINNVIPHSKGGELLCPGNNIPEGFVRLDVGSHDGGLAAIFVGLNNGNGRGSMDTAWAATTLDIFPDGP